MDNNNVLSKEKQLILTTLYLTGVRGISFQGDDFALKGCKNEFMGNLKFVKNGEDFDFSIMEQIMELRVTYFLKSIIEDLCPDYLYVLDEMPY